MFKLGSIQAADLPNWCISFQTQNYTWSRLQYWFICFETQKYTWSIPYQLINKIFSKKSIYRSKFGPDFGQKMEKYGHFYDFHFSFFRSDVHNCYRDGFYLQNYLCNLNFVLKVLCWGILGQSWSLVLVKNCKSGYFQGFTVYRHIIEINLVLVFPIN